MPYLKQETEPLHHFQTFTHVRMGADILLHDKVDSNSKTVSSYGDMLNGAS